MRKLFEKGNKIWLGKKHSEETKKKMSKAHKGKKFSEEHKRKLREYKKTDFHKKKISITLTGKRASLETRKKMSFSKIGNKNNKGKFTNKNGNWKGGKRLYFRGLAFERDNYTCQICGLKDVEIMELDHILPKAMYPEIEFDLNNLQTLCPNCHKRKSNKEKKMIFSFKKQNGWIKK